MFAGLILFLAAAQARWTPLEGDVPKSAGGAVLTKQPDGSYLASGNNPAQDTFTMTARSPVKGVTAFQLEAMADPSLGGGGPGRCGHGNIVLSEFKVTAGGKPVVIQKAAADFSQDGFNVSACLDGKNDTGWALMPELGKSHTAVFETASPLAAETITITLEYQSPHGQHVIGRFRLSVTGDKVPARGLTRPAAIDEIMAVAPSKRTPEQKQQFADYWSNRVDPAIRRGVEYLKSLSGYPRHDHVGDSDELVLYTWVHADVPENDPQFKALFDRMIAAPLERTYRVALQAMILEEVDRAKHQGRIYQCAQFFADNACKNGQWNYGEPTEFAKENPVPPARKDEATRPGGFLDFSRPAGRKTKPKVPIYSMKKRKPGHDGGDNSNSQYAALGVRACHEGGMRFEKDLIATAKKWWIDSQNTDGASTSGYPARGWCYNRKDEQPSYGSMTAGAVGAMAIFDFMLGVPWKSDPFCGAGVNWLTQHFSVAENPRQGGTWHYYYLYGLERAGILYDTEMFGKQEWYPVGAEYLLKQQQPNGSWHDAWNTCFAILFLKRATAPLEDVATGEKK